MNTEKLRIVMEEAERFLEKARLLKSAQRKIETYEYEGRIYTSVPSCPKESGAVRRASLDLSRALSEYRRY